jgi:hypothetical protein
MEFKDISTKAVEIKKKYVTQNKKLGRKPWRS